MAEGLSIRRFLVVLIGASIATSLMTPVASAQVSSATITLAEPGPVCAGDAVVLSWNPPADSDGLTGYQVWHRFQLPFHAPSSREAVVPADQTSMTFALVRGMNTFLVYSITSAGVAREPFAHAGIGANAPPDPMTWSNSRGTNSVGETTATVSFYWPGPLVHQPGGSLPNTVRITASPDGGSLDVPVPSFPVFSNDRGVTATFTGLTIGVAYTFSAVTFNACGTNSAVTSRTFTPGVAPTWLRSTPPLSVSRGMYRYKFAATGNPPPTLRLMWAPSWLTISPNGAVKGKPPPGTQSFSYLVVASNGVGVWPFPMNAVAGPFTVTVRDGGRDEGSQRGDDAAPG